MPEGVPPLCRLGPSLPLLSEARAGILDIQDKTPTETRWNRSIENIGP